MINPLIRAFIEDLPSEAREQFYGKTASEGSEGLKKFLKKNPAPSDEKFHAWAERKGIETDKAEAGAYRLAGKYVNLLTSGKSKGKSPEGVPPAEKRVGFKIEGEHTDDPELRKKIRNDHTTESRNYYKHLPAFEKMLETEKKGEAMNPLMTGFVDEMGKEAEEKKKSPSILRHALAGGAIALPIGAGLGALSRRLGTAAAGPIGRRLLKMDPKTVDAFKQLIHEVSFRPAVGAGLGAAAYAPVGAGIGAIAGAIRKGRFLRGQKEEKK